ncbi:S53 family peptidase [Chitinibacter bivalviorum]|uniref:S53 family peptidase n=1 Tax=Chitinibacter bivalviorum TaxID=2739434 RepID=A0A7H9BL01_9NEIS|nr:S53 family peptidase [Chitinibacter bivalviorum]QLG88938.1 S53 family peptidase [Chitinibacter bivalviorum]
MSKQTDTCIKNVATPLMFLFTVGLPLTLQGCGGGAATTSASTSTSANLSADAPTNIELKPTYQFTAALPNDPNEVQHPSTFTAADKAPGSTTAFAATSTTIFNPAQIRAAYGLPAIPAAGTKLTAAQLASLGSGQTIYIVDAYHDPNVATDLAIFNAKFGLPSCTTTVLNSASKLPLAAPTAGACNLTVAYANTANGLSSTPPAYNSGWQGEIALDVEWAHAIAPLARIVLIEGQDAMITSLYSAVGVANKMGAGAVSMSFGANEGSWVSFYDANFGAAGMTYLAASGDNGAGVSWPAVSSKVLSVGGTSLSYSGSGARSETAWSGSGGGVSAYLAMPAYQNYVSIPGKSATKPMRTVPDISFNSNPSTGQYMYMTPQGSSTGYWYGVGGTSIAAPQWAGLIAISNAQRALAGKAVLGQVQTALYKNIGAVATTYAASLLDVKSGSDGTCAYCYARAGYDQVTGLGTPNSAPMLTALAAY